MTDNTTVSGTTAGTIPPQDSVQIIIPDETKIKFPDLVKMILESKSMNNQERNYWLQVLPVMTEEQVTELRNILETEIKKLAEIEAKFGSKPAPVVLSADDLKRIEEEKRKKREEALEAEKAAQANMNPDDILSQLG